MKRKIASMNVAIEVQVLIRNEEIDVGTSDVPDIKTF